MDTATQWIICITILLLWLVLGGCDRRQLIFRLWGLFCSLLFVGVMILIC